MESTAMPVDPLPPMPHRLRLSPKIDQMKSAAYGTLVCKLGRKFSLHMTQNYSFQLLAPSASKLTQKFSNAVMEHGTHTQWLNSMQVLRGRIYLSDGAIDRSDLDCQGRHSMSGDRQAWHLLLVDADQELIGCVRYLLYEPSAEYHNLKALDSAIARHSHWGPKVRRALNADLTGAFENSLYYAEVGGWALAEKWRNTKAALEMLLGSFALGSLWGGCLGCCTATVRHSSASILRRFGGVSFKADGESIPSYEDPAYGCEMELLRFDYRNPAPRFAPMIKPLIATLARSPVITACDSNWLQSTSLTLTHDLAHLQAAVAARPARNRETAQALNSASGQENCYVGDNYQLCNSSPVLAG